MRLRDALERAAAGDPSGLDAFDLDTTDHAALTAIRADVAVFGDPVVAGSDPAPITDDCTLSEHDRSESPAPEWALDESPTESEMAFPDAGGPEAEPDPMHVVTEFDDPTWATALEVPDEPFTVEPADWGDDPEPPADVDGMDW